jgi:hypothetical protein
VQIPASKLAFRLKPFVVLDLGHDIEIRNYFSFHFFLTIYDRFPISSTLLNTYSIVKYHDNNPQYTFLRRGSKAVGPMW